MKDGKDLLRDIHSDREPGQLVVIGVRHLQGSIRSPEGRTARRLGDLAVPQTHRHRDSGKGIITVIDRLGDFKALFADEIVVIKRNHCGVAESGDHVIPGEDRGANDTHNTVAS